MKFYIHLIIVLCSTFISNAQNATITIGRGTDCFGRGACSITLESSNEYNATFVKNTNGTTTLRIYRQKLNKSDEDRIFGIPITEMNINTLIFRMEETIQIDHSIESLPASSKLKNIDKLKIGVYSTIITSDYIDIQILDE